MKLFRLLPLLSLLFLASCSSVDVTTDYDRTVNFSKYKTYNYNKTNIDNSKLSDLDKNRILSAIDEQMVLKGYLKNDNPDLFINLVTDS